MTGTSTGRRIALALLPIIAVLSVVGIAVTQDTGEAQPIVHLQPAPPVVSSEDAPVLGVIEALGVIDSAERYATAYWQQVAEYATDVNLAAWVAAHQPPPAVVHHAVVHSGGSASSGVTGVCGGATNGADRFIGRESGGNPGVYNSGGSGAWGCYQIMPGTWRGAGCDAFGAYGSASPAAQAQCASRLPMSAWGG